MTGLPAILRELMRRFVTGPTVEAQAIEDGHLLGDYGDVAALHDLRLALADRLGVTVTQLDVAPGATVGDLVAELDRKVAKAREVA